MKGLYFIGYALNADERPPVDALRQRIASAFGIGAALKIVPHLTVVRPFHADDVAPLLVALRTFAAQQTPIPVSFTGFGAFKEDVWYLLPEQLPALAALKNDAVALVAKTAAAMENQIYPETTFHVTLAYKDVSPETHQKIGEMLKDEPLPITHMTVGALSLFRHRGEGAGFEEIATYPFTA